MCRPSADTYAGSEGLTYAEEEAPARFPRTTIERNAIVKNQGVRTRTPPTPPDLRGSVNEKSDTFMNTLPTSSPSPLRDSVVRGIDNHSSSFS
jgi:hypothetical protein